MRIRIKRAPHFPENPFRCWFSKYTTVRMSHLHQPHTLNFAHLLPDPVCWKKQQRLVFSSTHPLSVSPFPCNIFSTRAPLRFYYQEFTSVVLLSWFHISRHGVGGGSDFNKASGSGRTSRKTRNPHRARMPHSAPHMGLKRSCSRLVQLTCCP